MIGLEHLLYNTTINFLFDDMSGNLYSESYDCHIIITMNISFNNNVKALNI